MAGLGFLKVYIADLLSPLACSLSDAIMKLFNIRVTRCESIWREAKRVRVTINFSNLKEKTYWSITYDVCLTRGHCLLTNEFTILGFEKEIVTWTCSMARQINVQQNFTNLCPFLVFLGNSYFETQFVCDKAVKLSVFSTLLFCCPFSLLFSKYIRFCWSVLCL